MKNLFLASLLTLASVASFADTNPQEDLSAHPAVLNGHLASVKKVELFNMDANRAPKYSQLVATVVYNAICVTPASFVVMKDSVDFSYTVVEAHAPVPRDRASCQAIMMVEAKIKIAEFGLLPKLDMIQVNHIKLE